MMKRAMPTALPAVSTRTALVLSIFMLLIVVVVGVFVFLFWGGPAIRDTLMVVHAPAWMQYEAERMTSNSCAIQSWYWENKYMQP